MAAHAKHANTHFKANVYTRMKSAPTLQHIMDTAAAHELRCGLWRMGYDAWVMTHGLWVMDVLKGQDSHLRQEGLLPAPVPPMCEDDPTARGAGVAQRGHQVGNRFSNVHHVW